MRKEFARRFAKLGFNHNANGVGRIRRCCGLQVGQFTSHLWAHQVGTRAEHLAQLDEGGAEFRKGEAHALLDFEIGDMLAINALDSILDPREIQALDPIGQTVFG